MLGLKLNHVSKRGHCSVPKHILNQWWLANWVFRNKHLWHSEKIVTNFLNKICLKMSSTKLWPFSSGPVVLNASGISVGWRSEIVSVDKSGWYGQVNRVLISLKLHISLPYHPRLLYCCSFQLYVIWEHCYCDICKISLGYSAILVIVT